MVGSKIQEEEKKKRKKEEERRGRRRRKKKEEEEIDESQRNGYFNPNPVPTMVLNIMGGVEKLTPDIDEQIVNKAMDDCTLPHRAPAQSPDLILRVILRHRNLLTNSDSHRERKKEEERRKKKEERRKIEEERRKIEEEKEERREGSHAEAGLSEGGRESL